MADDRQRRAAPRYRDVDELRDPDGILAVITEATSSGRLSVGFFKEFRSDPEDDESPMERSVFMRPKQLAAVDRLIPIVAERMLVLESDMTERQKSADRVRASRDAEGRRDRVALGGRHA